jgi:ubiquinone/menaquinone biosynthesis C-methylase UbiE
MILGAALWGVPGAWAAATPPYEFRHDHDPDGIGKFYMGREIAQVMGHPGADWLERPEREDEENPTRLIQELDLKAGEVVADIGAGSGYISRRLARQVGQNGRVFAVDVQPEMLNLLTNRARAAGITNIAAVLGTATNVPLSRSSVDMAILVDVCHEFEFPYEMMGSICDALKPGGRVVLVEYREEDASVPIKRVHKMSEAQVKKEMAVHPLAFVETRSALPWQHVMIFRRR